MVIRVLARLSRSLRGPRSTSALGGPAPAAGLAEPVDRGSELGVRVGRQHVEWFDDVPDAAIGSDHEERAIVHRVLRIVRVVELPDAPTRIAGEQDRKIFLTRPRGLRGIGVDADADDD